MPFLPGVSGSESSTVTSVPLNADPGCVGHRDNATVPGSDCRMKPYHAELGMNAPPWALRSSCPIGTGTVVPLSWTPERISQASDG